MKKKSKILIKLLSTSNSKHFYTTSKNKNNKKKIEIKKFDPKVKKHFIYKEIKIK